MDFTGLFQWLGLSRNVGWGYVGLFVLHVVATVSPLVIGLFKPGADFTDFYRRALGWWIVTGSLLVALSLGPLATLVLYGVISLLALRELVTIAPVRFSNVSLAVAVVAVVAQYVLIGFGRHQAAWTFLPLVVGLGVPVVCMLAEPAEDFARKVGTLQMSLMLAGFGLSQVPMLMQLPIGRLSVSGGAGLVMYIVVLAQFNDFAQYIWGKAFGVTRIVPNLSPKKTWAGFLGGLLTVAGLSWLLAPALTPIPSALAVLVGVFVAVGGFLGDLTVSAVKRDAGVKDTGNLLPGFGGVMDRFDSMVYVAPGFMLFLTTVYSL